MATATGTRKKTTGTAKHTPSRKPQPVTLEDHLNAWLSGFKTRTRKTLRKWYHNFLVSSTIAFWSFIAGYVLVHVAK